MDLEGYLNQFGKRLVKQSKRNLTQNGSKDTKKLYNSIEYDVKVSKNSFEFSLSMEDYGKFIDKGVRGAGGVRKTTSGFKKTNNKGKLWKIKAKNSIYKFGKSGGISPKHFEGWAKRKGLSPFAVAKAVYHQGIETTNFYTKPLNAAIKDFPNGVLEARGFEVEQLLKSALL